jgi:serine/threonine-protein kinase HipA
MYNDEKKIAVEADWLSGSPEIGTLYCNITRGSQVYSFEFTDSWLSEHSGLILDPDLLPCRGRQYLPDGKPIFGIFADCAPDRWGRKLMKRRESILAKTENRTERTLYETDYLLGVHDESRTGGLRFKNKETNEYYTDSSYLTTPPFTSLRELQQLSLDFEDNKDPYSKKWLEQLISPGSSLGGSRPKATVKAPDGSLWLAKFSAKHDEIHECAWEKVINNLAVLCGLNVPESDFRKFDNKTECFMSKRFDRDNKRNSRIHYSSAMTQLGKTDGEEASYLDIAEFLKQNSGNPNKDLKELWSRIAFNIAVSNTDDHLRNHGFLLRNNMWELSPVFDITPNRYRHEMSLNITDTDNSKSLELLMRTAKYYNLNIDDAKHIAINIFSTVRNNWKKQAIQYEIPAAEQELMSICFNDKSIIPNRNKRTSQQILPESGIER